MKEYLSNKKFILSLLGLMAISISFVAMSILNSNKNDTDLNTQTNSNTKQDFSRYNLSTNTSNSVIDLDKVLSGGPGKDGIPSIDSPKFVSVNEASDFLEDDYIGLFVSINGEEKFYPNNILVWHEIVNDEIGDKNIAVTFCPLCGSAIVFDRNLNGEILEFGVSGLLYESNLLMYDRKTESLWSQIEGRSVVGEYSNTELDIINSQLIKFEQIKEKYPDAKILSKETGINRDYSFYPYGDYETNDDSFLFPVTYKGEDIYIPTKEIMYASNIDGIPIAFVLSDLQEKGSAEITIREKTITATQSDGIVELQDDSGNKYPGFYTMWFSWANHNLEGGVNTKDGQVWFIK